MSPQTPNLTSYKALSFDCYGTLIDWEGGLTADLQPILSELPPTHPWNTKPLTAVEHFNAHSEHLWATKPTQPYDENLSESFSLLAAEAGVTLPPNPTEIGTGPGRWPAFADTVAGLLKLRQHYKLIILSNVNNANIQRAVSGPLSPAQFNGVYTAENIGSYKPSHNNFQYLFRQAKEDFDVDWQKGELLHVARSLSADIVPATELGFPSVWIARGGDVEENYGTGGNLKELEEAGKVKHLWKFDTVGEFADEVERQFAGVKAKGE